MRKLNKLSDVVDWRLCIGCGACSYICPNNSVKLLDFASEGIRPVATEGECNECTLCMDICPAVQSDFTILDQFEKQGPLDDFTKEWGAITGIWEGYAEDPEIRLKGSSGGALTALSTYCVEKLSMHGVLHSAQDPADPIRNQTRLSRSRSELIAATGSRYSPASVCNGLELVETAPSPCAIIGKPSEIAAIKNAKKLRPTLAAKIGVTMSFFCAETPSTNGTVALLEKMGLSPAEVRDLRYRGFGWPGHFAPTRQGDTEPCQKMTYRESWAFLQAFRPWSVQLWPDSSGELADISCGDPWYEAPDGKNPGFSLLVARTARGRDIIEGAVAAGYLSLKPAESWKLVKSQSGLLEKKGAIWGRRLAMRLLGLPVTRLDGLDLKHSWKPLSFASKVRAIFGTSRRIITRKLYRPLKLEPALAKPVLVRKA